MAARRVFSKATTALDVTSEMARAIHPMVPKHSFSTELGQMLGQDKMFSKNRNSFNMLLNYLAEREGFEPPIRLPVCRISSAVHSTALPPLRSPKRPNKPQLNGAM